MAETIIVLFLNLSAFHGDGEAVWLGDKGTVVVQFAQRAPCADRNCLFEFRLEDADLKRTREALAALRVTQKDIQDRFGIPDEVRVRLGYQGSGEFTNIEVWEADLEKNAKAISTLTDLSKRLVVSCARREPASSEPLSKGVKLYEPKQLQKPG